MPAKHRKLLIFGLVFLVILLVVAFGVYIPYLKAYDLIHPERRVLSRTPNDVGITNYEEVQFTTPDGLTLKGWYMPPQNGVVVIFVHGRAANRTMFLDEAALTTAQGYGALMFDLRAHGISDGTRSTLGAAETDDVLSAVSFVRSRAAGAKIALFGHSMGAAASLLATARTPEVSAVIAASPFTSLEDNISDGVRSLTGLPPFPFAPLVIFFAERESGINLHSVRPIDSIAQISPRAVLLIHGELDPLFAAQNSRILYEAAGEPKELYIVPEVAHGGFFQRAPKRYPKTILNFLNTYLKGK